LNISHNIMLLKWFYRSVNELCAVVLLVYLTVAVPQAGCSKSAAEGVNFCTFSIPSET